MAGGLATQPRRSSGILAAVIARLIFPTFGLYLEGDLPRKANFAEFVGKFCFDWTTHGETIGLVHFEVTAEARPHDVDPSHDLYVMVYDDEDKYWLGIRDKWSSLACAEKREAANFARIVNLQNTRKQWAFTLRITEHLRPRLWYFTFVNCGTDLTDVPVHYKIHATNIELGAQQEFSIDRLGLPWLYIASAALFLGAACVTAKVAKRSDVPLRQHPFVQLLMLGYVASVASSACFIVHYAIFARDGFGSKRLRFLGVVSGIVANCTIYVIAMFAGCGWAITTVVLPHRRTFLAAVTMLGCMHALAELHAQLTVDQSAKMFAYSGVGGMLALSLKMLMFFWFRSKVRISCQQEICDHRRRFYEHLRFGMSIWACTVPVAAAMALGVSPWVRYKWVTGFEIVSRLAGLCLLSRLLCGSESPLSCENTFQISGPDPPELLDGCHDSTADIACSAS
mmetsp:Transcript_95495/g.275730  ORF Transcript_95495/g.275730 Transcript_95495/m.275730 type:complete len:453 (+) Transcript_95495:58-1416(+)